MDGIPCYFFTILGLDTGGVTDSGKMRGQLESMWVINFDTEANAKRFATAFKRAVVLCGGKTSTF